MRSGQGDETREVGRLDRLRSASITIGRVGEPQDHGKAWIGRIGAGSHHGVAAVLFESIDNALGAISRREDGEDFFASAHSGGHWRGGGYGHRGSCRRRTCRGRGSRLDAGREWGGNLSCWCRSHRSGSGGRSSDYRSCCRRDSNRRGYWRNRCRFRRTLRCDNRIRSGL